MMSLSDKIENFRRCEGATPVRRILVEHIKQAVKELKEKLIDWAEDLRVVGYAKVSPDEIIDKIFGDKLSGSSGE